MNLAWLSYFIENKICNLHISSLLLSRTIWIICNSNDSQCLTKISAWNIAKENNTGISPLLLVFAFFASWARVAAIKLSWANSWTRRNQGMLLSVLSLERKSFPESSASSCTNTKCSAEEPRPGRNKRIYASYPPSNPCDWPWLRISPCPESAIPDFHVSPQASVLMQD